MDPPASQETIGSSSSSPLSAYQIPNLPPSIYYIPNFITPEEEASLLQKIPPNRWTQLTHRRLQAHPSTLTSTNVLLHLGSPTSSSSGNSSNGGATTSNSATNSYIPPWLIHPILPRFAALGVFAHTPHQAPNHVLVNEYRPGEGIMPHEDGPAYAPVVATVSLGGRLVLDLYAKREEGEEREEREEKEDPDAQARHPKQQQPPNTTPIARILQEPGSLLVTTGDAYTALLHGIAPVERDMGLLGEERDGTRNSGSSDGNAAAGVGRVANWAQLTAATRAELEQTGGVSERGTRVSLTYRDVLKVKDVGKKILGRR